MTGSFALKFRDHLIFTIGIHTIFDINLMVIITFSLGEQFCSLQL